MRTDFSCEPAELAEGWQSCLQDLRDFYQPRLLSCRRCYSVLVSLIAPLPGVVVHQVGGAGSFAERRKSRCVDV